jgi:transcriptional regulator with XRE-family HTH domain
MPSSSRLGRNTAFWKCDAMKKRTYRTITGRPLDLSGLSRAERDFLGTVQSKYEAGPEWSTFASWWSTELRKAGLSQDSVAYRLCQDLEARLGIAQGRVAPPDYRDYLADLIEERYGSRYRFCKESGGDPGHLSRVLSSRSELSLQNLQRILDALHASLVIQPEEDLARRVSPERGARDLAAAAR